MPKSCVRSILAFVVSAALGVAESRAQVTVNVQDQHGTPIPGSKVDISGVGVVATGASVNLSPGTYAVRVIPGVFGVASAGALSRTESFVVASGQSSASFEWITATVTVDVVDQSAAPIVGSEVELRAYSGQTGSRGVAPFTVTLPITDPAVYATSTGSQSEVERGYDLLILPGIEGQPNDGALGRIEGIPSGAPVEVHAATSSLRFEWRTAPVRIDLVDQYGTSIPGSQVTIVGSSFSVFGPVFLPMTVTLPINDASVYPAAVGNARAGDAGYNLQLAPGIEDTDTAFGGKLYRNVGQSGSEPVIVNASTTELIYEWITTEVVVDVKDQHGASLAGSSVVFNSTESHARTPYSIVFPITDPSVYPTMHGSCSEHEGRGIDMHIYPGIAGSTERRMLGRVAGTTPLSELVQVHAGQTTLDFEWITTDLTVHVHDQYGADIPGSYVSIYGVAFELGRATPFGITLPISDPAVYPTMSGMLSEGQRRGYDCLVNPGIDNQLADPTNVGSFLFRSVGTDTSPESVTVHADTTELRFEWIVDSCNMQLVDDGGVFVPGSTIDFDYPVPVHHSGDVVHLPITDNSVYPTLGGHHANGIAALIAPGNVAPANAVFLFEVLGDGEYSPASFMIAGNTYRLACGDNLPPSANAGDNTMIFSNEQPDTVLHGTATDPDGNVLTFRWLEGANVLAGPSPVGTNGDALLDLGALAALSVGDHHLVLEVTDGEFTVTSTVILTVGNSPPTVTCSGSGVYQAGIDHVVVQGVVADYDGDTLSYTLSEGSDILATGAVGTSAGGAATSLVPIVLATGSLEQLDVGTHGLMLTVSDQINPPVSCPLVVDVIDSLAPGIGPTSDCGILWPPNHQMVTVTIQAHAADASGGPVTLAATVTSSEDPDKRGDGSTIPDFTAPVIDQQTGTITLQLRAERAGNGPGRTYTITITATDGSHNVSTATVTCIAPHDRRR